MENDLLRPGWPDTEIYLFRTYHNDFWYSNRNDDDFKINCRSNMLPGTKSLCSRGNNDVM